jgi:hypothetical protein
MARDVSLAGACRPGARAGVAAGCHTGQVPKIPATVRLEDEVLDAVRREATRSGKSEDDIVEAAVRRYVGPSVIDRLRERNRLDEEEAMAIALDEIAAHRRDRRTG